VRTIGPSSSPSEARSSFSSETAISVRFTMIRSTCIVMSFALSAGACYPRRLGSTFKKETNIPTAIDLSVDAALELEELRQNVRDDAPALGAFFNLLRSPVPTTPQSTETGMCVLRRPGQITASPSCPEIANGSVIPPGVLSIAQRQLYSETDERYLLSSGAIRLSVH
jgi:hypothetical protein